MSWDGKMYDKYRIERTDGTPLKGKKYFVLRLDSDDPVEAARVAAAMRAYKNEPRQCDVGTPDEQVKRFEQFCGSVDGLCDKCELDSPGVCPTCGVRWSQWTYKAPAEGREAQQETKGE